jgi:serine protease AprX
VITQDLQNHVKNVSDSDWIRINITMKDQIDLEALENEISIMGHENRRSTVVNALKEFTQNDQKEVLEYFRDMERSGDVKKIRSLWINNVVATYVKKDVLTNLSSMEGIRSIDLDEERNMLLPTSTSLDPNEDPPRIASLEWNISLINAPSVWAQGYTGQGILVGNFDTGVNYNHWDLQDHIWVNSGEIPSNGIDDDGNGYIDDIYGYNFNGGSGDPMDGHRHGTHTAGTVAGDGSAGDTTGVAPDATIMCLKVLDNTGNGFESDVWEAIGYAINEGVQVMTFSIGWSHAWSPNRPAWRSAFESALAAGVHSSVASGNEDNSYGAPDNVRTPGDVPPPWLHPDQTLTGGLGGVMTVGATNSGDNIAGFSSRGPVEWDFLSPWFDYPYNPEMGLIDPDVSAPGVCVTSLRHNNNSGYASCWNGTSMATPHVAGLMALMLSKSPTLTPAVMDSIIEVTAVELGSAGKDNSYGAGRINVLDAVNAVIIANSPNLTITDNTVTDTTGGDGDGRPEESESAEIVVTLQNEPGFLDASLVQATISTSDTSLTLIDSVASFPDIPSGTSGDNGSDPFVFSVNTGIIAHWATFYIQVTAEPNSFVTTDSFTVRIGRPPILLVDDDEGDSYEDYYTEPLDNLLLSYDQWNILSSGTPGSELDHYSCVIWFTGDTDTLTLTPQDESDLSSFLDGGGKLFISGQNIGEEIGGVSFFYISYLRAVILDANADDNLLSGVPGDPISNGLNIDIQGGNGAGNADSEDRIAPLLGSSQIFTYTNSFGTGALRYDSGTFRVVYFAFPFEAISAGGSFASRDTVMARVMEWLCFTTVGVEETPEFNLPNAEFKLFQNQPNPFNKLTAISYQLRAPSHTVLKVYDIAGKLVATLVDEKQKPGIYQLPITSNQLPGSGVYFYRLTSGGEVETRKMTLLR